MARQELKQQHEVGNTRDEDEVVLDLLKLVRSRLQDPPSQNPAVESIAATKDLKVPVVNEANGMVTTEPPTNHKNIGDLKQVDCGDTTVVEVGVMQRHAPSDDTLLLQALAVESKTHDSTPTPRTMDRAQQPHLHRSQPVVPKSQPGAFAEGPGGACEALVSLVRESGVFTQRELQVAAQEGPAPPIHQHEIECHPTRSVVEAQPVDDDLEKAQPMDPEAQQERQRRHCKQLGRPLLTLVFVASVVATSVIVIVLTLGAAQDEGTFHDLEMTSKTKAPQLLSTLAPSNLLDGILSDLPNYTLESLQDPFSPQSMAWDWVASHRDIASMQSGRKKQLLALATLYYTLDGPSWPFNLQKDWLDDSKSECDWFSYLWGIFFLDAGNNTVYQEYQGPQSELASCNDRGEFIAFVCRDIASSGFSLAGARLPPEFALLTSLEQITVINHHFLNTSLSDLFPSQLAHLSKLTKLEIINVQATGTIPTYLGLMSSLLILDLSDNPLSEATIPTEIGQMTSLMHLNLADTSLVGTVPHQLGALASNHNLSYLSLEGNDDLSGHIPSALCSLNRGTCGLQTHKHTQEGNCNLVFSCSPTLCGCSCDCPTE